MIEYPFQNTKATYFNDAEIVKYWVAINEKRIHDEIMLPQSSVPTFILGGKGSGKTHILRYFSFQSQKIRAINKGDKLLNYISHEGYLGLYIVSSSLSANRFNGRGISDDQWRNIFYYYINLEILETFTKKLVEILKDNSEYFDFKIKIDSFYSKFNKSYKILELYEEIKKYRVDIDERVSKLCMPGADTRIMNGIEPIFEISSSCFSIIKEILVGIKELNKLSVLIIIDEFENLNEYQQIFFNTLLRHPKNVDCIKIRIAGRLYSIKTKKTLDSSEKLLQESEVRYITLDNLFKENYDKFTEELYKKRLHESGQTEKSINFASSFENSVDYYENTLSELQKENHKDKLYFKKLENNLLKKYNQKDINLIIRNLQNENILYEKINTFLCYKNIGLDLVSFSKNIKNNSTKKNYEEYATQLDKFKEDMIYQLFREFRKNYYYGGYKDIVKISYYNPRIFLSILNNIHLGCKNNNIDMFKDKIPIKIQHFAILQASNWFWNNFTEDVSDNKILWAVNSLCEYFRMARQSLKPSEKTLISFSYNSNEVDDKINNLVDLAIDHSLLIENEDKKFRKDKNSALLKRQLRIHPMLSPKWELPLSIGGTTNFSKEDMEALFGKDEKKWIEIRDKKLKLLNPLFSRKLNQEEPSLFSEVNK